MDRSYLSDPAVVEATRAFVCARLLTYEDAEEAALMRRLLPGRGSVNTAFTVLAPDGDRQLVRAGRSPRMAFGSARKMAAELRRIAERFPGKRKVKPEELGLPLLDNLRLAMNVTECDAQQLVVLRGSEKELRSVSEHLRELCWSEELIGRFLYVRAGDEPDWDKLDGVEGAPDSGVVVVRTDPYGLTGEVIASAPSDIKLRKLRDLLVEAASSFAPKPVDTRRLARKGRRQGVRWETELPLPRKR